MSKTIKQFGYKIITMKKGDALPFNPHIEIILDHWMHQHNDNTPIISAHLMSEGEIDFHIQQLKDDLDEVGKRAKAALHLAKARTKVITTKKESD